MTRAALTDDLAPGELDRVAAMSRPEWLAWLAERHPGADPVEIERRALEIVRAFMED